MAAMLGQHFFGNTALLKSFEKSPARGLTISYPLDGTIFPMELVAPTFRWNDARETDNAWVISVNFDGMRRHWEFRVSKQQWRPAKALWETIKKLSTNHTARITIVGFSLRQGNKTVCGDKIAFTTSKDRVENPLFYRDVVLPF